MLIANSLSLHPSTPPFSPPSSLQSCLRSSLLCSLVTHTRTCSNSIVAIPLTRNVHCALCTGRPHASPHHRPHLPPHGPANARDERCAGSSLINLSSTLPWRSSAPCPRTCGRRRQKASAFCTPPQPTALRTASPTSGNQTPPESSIEPYLGHRPPPSPPGTRPTSRQPSSPPSTV